MNRKGPLTPAQIAEFHQNGFLKIGRVLTEPQIEKLRAELARVSAGKTRKQPVLNRNLAAARGTGYEGQDATVVQQVVNIWQASRAFFKHAWNPKITTAVAQLCDTKTLRIWHDQIQYKPPKVGGPTGWHQDGPLWPSIQPFDMVSAWVALDDATIENGCMWMVPGSHHWGNQQRFLRSGPTFEPVHTDPSQLPPGAEIKAVPFEIRKGECGFHHCLTWHGSPHNRSDKPRRAIAVHYMPAHIRYQPTGKHVMEQHITVKPGEILQGDAFPVVLPLKPAR